MSKCEQEDELQEFLGQRQDWGLVTEEVSDGEDEEEDCDRATFKGGSHGDTICEALIDMGSDQSRDDVHECEGCDEDEMGCRRRSTESEKSLPETDTQKP